MVLSAVVDANTSLSDFFIGLLSNHTFNDEAQMFLDQSDLLLEALLHRGREKVLSWAKRVVSEKCEEEMIYVSEKDSTLRFVASDTTEEKIQTFDISKISHTFQTALPCLWSILGKVLNSETRNKYHCTYSRQSLSRGSSQQEVVLPPQDVSDVEMRGPGDDGGMGDYQAEALDRGVGRDEHAPAPLLREHQRDQLLEIVITHSKSLALRN